MRGWGNGLEAGKRRGDGDGGVEVETAAAAASVDGTKFVDYNR